MRDVIARVLALAARADELAKIGHVLRSAEKYGRAAEAARPLGADNLVALEMQLYEGNKHAVFAAASDGAPSTRAAHRAQFVALLSAAVAALERRRVAGTLLEGECAAAEEAWHAGALQQGNARTPAAAAVSWAALVGYDTFMRAASDASLVLARAREFTAECSAAQLHSFAEHVVHAAAMMQQPRRLGHVPMVVEARFVEALRDAAAAAGASGLDARLVQQLAGACERLQRSGVLQARRIAEASRVTALRHRALDAALEKSMSAPDLRCCALPGCGAKEAHPTHFKSCAACRAVVYCCREHQVAGWPSHEKACKAARKAAAAAAEEEDGAGPSGA